MILVYNKAALTTPVSIPAAGATIPLDTIVHQSNDGTALNDNTIQLLTVGWYDTVCELVLENTSTSAAAVITLAQYADGKAIDGAKIKVSIPASGTMTLTLPWALHIVGKAGSTANTSWHVSGAAVNLNSAVAKVFKYV